MRASRHSTAWRLVREYNVRSTTISNDQAGDQADASTWAAPIHRGPQRNDQGIRRHAAVAAEQQQQLEAWYDQHPAASFGEIEEEARRLRRVFMGHGLAVVINGRDTGFQLEAPPCPQCAQPMAFVGYRPWRVAGLEGETELERAYYVCRGCEEQTLFPPG